MIDNLSKARLEWNIPLFSPGHHPPRSQMTRTYITLTLTTNLTQAETDSSLEDDPIDEKSHLEENLDDLYVAYADDEDEIAKLRTFHYRKFSHILRVVPVLCTFTEPIPGRVDQPAGTVNKEIEQSRRQTRTLSSRDPQRVSDPDTTESLPTPCGS